MKTKTCSKCRIGKNVIEFYKANHHKDGLTSQCKKCIKIRTEKYNEDNKEKLAIKAKKYRDSHKEQSKESAKKWAKRNKDKVIAKTKRWQAKNPEKVKAISAKWHKEHPKRTLELCHEWRAANPKKVAASNKKSRKKRRRTINGKLYERMSSRIRVALKGNKSGCRWETLVGYTLIDLKQHLKKLFTKGMNWNNYGYYGWHIDHVKPMTLFKYTNVNQKEFKDCWALQNLQPLWAIDNFRKNSKYPFQVTS